MLATGSGTSAGAGASSAVTVGATVSSAGSGAGGVSTTSEAAGTTASEVATTSVWLGTSSAEAEDAPMKVRPAARMPQASLREIFTVFLVSVRMDSLLGWIEMDDLIVNRSRPASH